MLTTITTGRSEVDSGTKDAVNPPSAADTSQDFIPADYVRGIFNREMGVTLSNYLAGSPRDEAMKNLTQEAVNLYTKRVLRELVQNAFDGAGGDEARILVRLERNDSPGTLQIANTGRGFTPSNVDAVSSPAMSNKTPGNYIGHKGLGFRSVELLSDRVEIHSMLGAARVGATAFDGFRFRFATDGDQEAWLVDRGHVSLTTELVDRVHRLQLPVPVTFPAGELDHLAKEGYATLVHLPLRDEAAVASASAEIGLLVDNAAPVSLFLRGLKELRIQRIGPNVDEPDEVLGRDSKRLEIEIPVEGATVEEVTAEGSRYLVARMPVDDPDFRASVAEAVARRYPVEQWGEWKGTPEVSIALRLGGPAREGVVYAFLPMNRRSPFNGHVDAPFHPDADRKDIDTENPLNRFLLGQVAELCVRVAVAIAQSGIHVAEWEAAVVDAIAWTAEAELVEEACERLGIEVGALPVPGMRRGEEGLRWSQMDEVIDWPDDRFFYLRRSLAVRVCGLPILPAGLGATRIEALAEFAESTGFTLDAGWSDWREWAPAFAANLAGRRKLTRGDWEQFYADLAKMPEALDHLHGTAIFRLEDGSLANANEEERSAELEVFITASAEGETVRNRRKLGGASTPPDSVTKRILIADQGLSWPPSVAEAFIKAGLATRYDLPRVLSRLRTLLGPKPRRASIVAALGWAFAVWRDHRSPDVEASIRKAELAVPVARGGTRKAGEAYFGVGWRDTHGDALSDFLAHVHDDLASVRHLRDGQLAAWDDWDLRDRGSASDWTQFLRLLGVRDGLAVQFVREIKRSIGEWVSIRLNPDAEIPNKSLIGPWWRSAIHSTSPWSGFRYQSGHYSTGNTLYILPAQAAQPEMSDEAKTAYCTLVTSALGEIRGDQFRTSLDRTSGNSDTVGFPSPLAAFLRQASWLPVSSGEGPTWRRPDECWYAQKGEQLPRFVPRLLRAARDVLDSSKTARERMVGKLGLRLWNEQASAPARLEELGRIATEGVGEADLDAFRKAHREAWQDWHSLDPRPALPDFVTLVADRGGRPVGVGGGDTKENARTIHVGDGSDVAREQLVSALGHDLLVVPPGTAADVVVALSKVRSDRFVPLDQAILTVRADGEEVAPGQGHRAIVADGREWLAEIAVLVLEFNDTLSSRNTAKSRQALYDAFSRLRVVFADRITVEMGEVEGALPDVLGGVLALPDADNPTILIQGESTFDWAVLTRLARSFASALRKPSLELPFRLTFLELERSIGGAEGPFARPTDEQIAQALGHPASRVREVKRSLRTSNRSLFELLIPLVYVLGGATAARRLREREDRLVDDHDIETLLVMEGLDRQTVTRLIAAARSADSLDSLRREFAIQFVDFNGALAELGSPWEPLDLGPALRTQFAKWLEANRVFLEERVRDRHADAYASGGSLEPYLKAKTLDWATFDEKWPARYDDLSDAVVEARIDELLVDAEGDAPEEPGPPLDEMRRQNHATLTDGLDRIARIVSVWIARNAPMSPATQLAQRDQVGRTALASGAMDFAPLGPADLPACLARAGLWPQDMPQTLELQELQLSEADLAAKEVQEENDRQTKLKERRTVTFGKTEVDGGETDGLQKVAEALETVLSSAAFQKRSGAAELVPLTGGRGGGGNGGKRKPPARDPEYSSEEQRVLLGFAGELAAYRYLRRAVRAFSDGYWISSMGRRYLGLQPMNDSDGYDFHVRRSRGPDLFYEVKAHTGDPGYVDLERSQVEAALTFADETRGIWRILYVPWVKDPELITVHELCNPYSDEGRRLFRQKGNEAVRLEMRRA